MNKNIYDVFQLAKATKKVHELDIFDTMEIMRETFKDMTEEESLLIESALFESFVQEKGFRVPDLLEAYTTAYLGKFQHADRHCEISGNVVKTDVVMHVIETMLHI